MPADLRELVDAVREARAQYDAAIDDDSAWADGTATRVNDAERALCDAILAAPAMAADEALSCVQDALLLDLGFTVKGDELKGWKHEPDGTSKFYVTADECSRLSVAFAALADRLAKGRGE